MGNINMNVYIAKCAIVMGNINMNVYIAKCVIVMGEMSVLIDYNSDW